MSLSPSVSTALIINAPLVYLQIGDRVACMKSFGLWRQFATVAADQCFVIPEKMSFEEAAAMPVNYITAYHMLFNLGGLRAGQSVLIHMAAGTNSHRNRIKIAKIFENHLNPVILLFIG